MTFLTLLWDFKVFTQVWAIRQGGPDGGSQTLPALQYLKASPPATSARRRR